MAKKPPVRKTPMPTAEEAVRRFEVMERAIRQDREFQLDELESALGMYVLAHHLGWKVLYFAHSKKTIRKYEDLLGLKLSEHFPEFGPDAHRTNAYKIIQKVSNFWKLVSGEEKPALDLDKRTIG
jgi:hypothetical protein